MLTNELNLSGTFAHHTAMLDDVRLHYVMGGGGDPVVLLHGWPSTWYHWRKVMPALAERYTVIAPDLRGFGDSSKPLSGYDTRTVAGDVYKLVQQLELGRIFLVGHDMGAVHAYTYANQHRQDVQRLVYLDEPLPGFTYEQYAAYQPETPPGLEGGFWFAHFNRVLDLPEALYEGREHILLWHLYRMMGYDLSAFSEEDVAEYVRAFSTGGMRGSLGVYRDIPITSEQNREAAKEKLTIPVLALGGEAGMGEVPLNDMRQVAEDVRGEVIERCGHFIAEERPEYLVERLVEFFEEENGNDK